MSLQHFRSLLHAGVLNNTYKHVRVLADAYNVSYTVWCDNEHELYDLQVRSPRPRLRNLPLKPTSPRSQTDPYQNTNLYGRNGTVSGYDITKLSARLDALILTLKACKGSVCVRPWETLHPQGNVHDLADAMDPEYDDFYLEQQLKVTFSACEQGYIIAAEGAMAPLPYNDTDATAQRREL